MPEIPLPLRVTFDPEANAAYIYLADEPPLGWHHGKTIPLDPAEVGGMVNIDLDDDGRLIGIEVLGARSLLSDKDPGGPRPRLSACDARHLWQIQGGRRSSTRTSRAGRDWWRRFSAMTDRPGRRDLLFWVPRAALAMGTVGWAAIAVRAARGDEIQVGAFVAFGAVAIAALPLVVLISLRPASTARRLSQRRRTLPESVLMFVGVPIFMSGSALQDAVGATLSKGEWIVLVSAAILCGASGSLAVLKTYDSIAHAEVLARSGG